MVKSGSRWMPPSRRLDATDKTTLASSINQLLPGDRGWITFEEASRLFSTMQPQYAFGEMDDDGKQNLEKFARDVSREFEFGQVNSDFISAPARPEAWLAHRTYLPRSAGSNALPASSRVIQPLRFLRQIVRC
jgi:hypothetical protein